MTDLSDREIITRNVREATAAGARQGPACHEAGLSDRTFRRWTKSGAVSADKRPDTIRPAPRNKLTEPERAEIITLCNSAQFSSMSPAQIVPALADQGRYVASESSFYRVLREAAQMRHRGRAKPPQKRKAPTTYQATGPCQVWTWDITWLPGPVKGMFFYLYLIVDIYSRKIVGWEVHTSETSELAAQTVRKAVWAEKCAQRPLVLYADNGSPMKGSTLKTTLENLGIAASYSRPRVSNDNPFSEALFRTCKYRPDWPRGGFATIEDAQTWVKSFADWYNNDHLHSAIRFVSPITRHTGQDCKTLAKRAALYANARALKPERWSGNTRNWTPVGPVWLNPDRSENGLKTRDAA